MGAGSGFVEGYADRGSFSRPSPQLLPCRYHRMCQCEGHTYSSLLRSRQTEGISVAPYVISYTAATTVCGNGGQWEWAVGLLMEMEGSSVAPNVLIYSSIITAYKGLL